MTRRARELETLLLAMFAAVPLYFTDAISTFSLSLFHLAMTAIVLRVVFGRGPELIPAHIMRWLAIAYVPFYVFDAVAISRSAIAASTHLVLFIAAYQPIESVHRSNHAQRILTTALIFIASLATSTHLTIVPFVFVFAFFVFRQLMYLSHQETATVLGHEYGEPPTARAAGFYLIGALLLGALLFPLLPRLRNPLVRGFSGPLAGASTALTDTINLNRQRSTPQDATIVARVWIDEEARPYFTPVRLRGMIYDRYDEGEWRQNLRGLRQVPSRSGTHYVARLGGYEHGATMELRTMKGKVFLPPGTYQVRGIQTLYEGAAPETYYTYDDGPLTLDLRLSTEPQPLLQRSLRARFPIGMSGYPISPAVETLAHTIVGEEQSVAGKAALIEQFMLRNFRYIPNDATSLPKSLERFLLFDRGGHCEYFAAGMVALLNAVDVPARIAGGFYGGQLNPLTGYYAIRREDAHAWTEVWDGTRWITFDATPASLRPGAAKTNPLMVYLAALGDSLTFFWDRYVLTYGLGDQIELFTDAITWAGETVTALRGRVRSMTFTFSRETVGAAMAVVVAVGLVVLLIRRRRRRSFDFVAEVLAAQGVQVKPAMTVEEAIRQLQEQRPEAAEELAPLVALYEEEAFSRAPDAKRSRSLRRKLAELKT